jgi:hypothetical protein
VFQPLTTSLQNKQSKSILCPNCNKLVKKMESVEVRDDLFNYGYWVHGDCQEEFQASINRKTRDLMAGRLN